MQRKQAFRRAAEFVLPSLVLIFLLLYSYACFFVWPYLGFDYDPGEGRVVDVWVERPAFQSLQAGDRLLKVGLQDWSSITADYRVPVLANVRPGDVIDLLVQRGDQQFSVPWQLRGPSPEEVFDRFSIVWLGFVFWLAGTATIFLVRPRKLRWKLLIAFYYLMSGWLMLGLISRGHIWYSGILMRVLAWLVIPVYLHLNWAFPRPLGRIPPAVLWASYLCAGLLAALELFQLLPRQAYAMGLMLSLATSAVFLIMHGLLQPDVRRDLRVLAAAILLAVFSGLLLGSQAMNLVVFRLWFVWAALLSLSTIPGAYFYVIYRSQLGELELRANRIVSFYLFSILVFGFSAILVWLINYGIADPGLRISLEMAGVLLAALVAVMIYPGFRRLIERRLLGMPLPPTHLLETYSARITTSLEAAALAGLLQDEILPSLLVRQSALLRIGEDGSVIPLYARDVARGQLPAGAEVLPLAAEAGKSLSSSGAAAIAQSFGWIRLILPLEASNHLIGIWLLGRRDPDDFYAQSEISVLKSIANQTAIALVNIAHSELLHALYQENIERGEKERAALARGLHDEVLNQLAAVFMRQPEAASQPGSPQAEEEIASYLRDVITDLRPAMLSYGLGPAIEELADQLSERVQGIPAFKIVLASDGVRFDPNIEQHVFRILQQAGENAVRHAQASQVRIHGELQPDCIHLAVEDDGVGFAAGSSPDLAELLRLKHYGLMGMYERAAIIGADLRIHSEPGRGTCVEVVWSKKDQEVSGLKTPAKSLQFPPPSTGGA